MIKLPRMKILDPSDFDSQKEFEEFDVRTVATRPLVFRRGKARYVLGEIRRAYRARDGIFADILLSGRFKGEFRKGKVEVRLIL